MYSSFFAPALLLTASLLVDAQFVTPPTSLTRKTGYAGVDVRYKQVPAGICEQDPNVKSYSGYADVSEDEHIFWWFFEARNIDPTDAPLTVWINGGPGSSSMIGLFQELGPCGINYDGDVYNNPYSWTNVSNMLFIDQPTQTGFSYAVPVPAYIDDNSGDIIVLPNSTCPDYASDSACGTYSAPNTTLTANSTVAAAPNFWKTLQGFMGAFPDYSRSGFYFASESYGGHYGPIFNDYILSQNAANIPGAHNISLEAVLIGNGWYDPILQYEAYYNFSSSTPGNTYNVSTLPYNSTVDAQVYNNLYGPGNCYDQLIDCNSYRYATNVSDGTGNEVCAAADTFCYNDVEYYYDIVTGRDEYDVRYLTPDPFPYNFYVDYLNTAEVQAAIGAFTNYSDSSPTVGAAFGSTGDDAREIGVTAALDSIISQNVTVVLYFGDADYICNWIGGEAFSYQLTATPSSYTSGAAGFTNITTSDAIVHGQVKTAGKFNFVRIYEAGHEVPFYQPLVALEMFTRVLAGKDIATGLTTIGDGTGYMTNGTVQSTFLNGGDTVTNDLVPVEATYNTTTNMPDPYNTTDSRLRKKRDVPGMQNGWVPGTRIRERKQRALEDWLKL